MPIEKVYELKIEDDDDISGVDFISIVDEPAIEVNFVAFNKHKDVEEHSFHIPDNEDEIYLEKLIPKGKPEQELFDDGWELDNIQFLNKQDFAISTNPNAPSFEDTPERRVRYKYIKNPQAKGDDLIKTSRNFCRELVSKNLVWTADDMEKTTNEFGDSALVWRGGYNCRHLWCRMLYKPTGNILNKAVANTGKLPGQTESGANLDVLGYTQPDTRTSNPSFAKVNCEKISMDYDDTLSTQKGKDLAKSLIAAGNDLSIITRRHKNDLQPVLKVAKDLGIPSNKVHATDGKLKWELIKKLGIQKHIDNNPDEIKAIKDNVKGVDAVKFDYVNGLPSFVDNPIKKKKKKGFAGVEDILFKEEFGSHTDYPDAVKHNAQAVLDYVEKNGWGSCGTQVGKTRCQQLAQGKPISDDTIHRMYSYLSRHKVDLQTSKSYDDGCGKLMYDSWGGLSALQWSKSKVNSMNSHNFAQDEDKRITLGPAMIPDEKIFRKDEQGNPYYVFFSADTIKMICDKFMRNQYTHNADENHDGEKLKDVYVIESWVKESMDYDKGNAYGFSALPIGTWFVSFKINNDDVWQKIKAGELRGYSVSGFFEENAVFSKEEMFLYQVAQLLK